MKKLCHIQVELISHLDKLTAFNILNRENTNFQLVMPRQTNKQLNENKSKINICRSMLTIPSKTKKNITSLGYVEAYP